MANLYTSQFLTNGADNLVFNDGTVGEYRLMKIQGRDDGALRNPVDKMPQTDGAYAHKFFRDAKYPTLFGIITPDADPILRDQRIDALMGFMDTIQQADGQYCWQMSDQTQEWRFLNVRKWDQILIEEGSTSSVTLQVSSKSNSSLVPYWKTFVVPLIAYDPTAYGANSLNPLVSETPISARSTAAIGDGGSVIINNAGNRNTFCDIRLDGPVTGFNIVNNQIFDPNTGTFAKVVGGDQSLVPGNVKPLDITGGDHGTIGMGPIRQTFNLSDQTNLLGSIDFLQTSFWGLLPGDNEIDVHITGGGTATFSWYNGYAS